jgi:hypothetical protein
VTALQRRCRRVLLLLGSLNDVLPGPSTWTGTLVRRSAKAGPGPSHRLPCVPCEGRGRVRDRFGRESQCLTCNGHGVIDVDSYTSEQVSTSTVLLTRSVTVRCDRCAGEGVWKFKRCELCDGSGRRSITPDNPNVLGQSANTSSSLNLWGRHGSYHELDEQLHQLAAIDVGAARQVRSALVDSQAEAPTDTVQLAAAVTWIAYRMPDTIEVPPGVAAADKRARQHLLTLNGKSVDPRARASRDREIRRLAREGRGVQWIAANSALSIRSVYAILKSHP